MVSGRLISFLAPIARNETVTVRWLFSFLDYVGRSGSSEQERLRSCRDAAKAASLAGLQVLPAQPEKKKTTQWGELNCYDIRKR